MQLDEYIIFTSLGFLIIGFGGAGLLQIKLHYRKGMYASLGTKTEDFDRSEKVIIKLVKWGFLVGIILLILGLYLHTH